MEHIEHPDIAKILSTGYVKEPKPKYKCPHCGNYLYGGDHWYPEFGVCEYCVDIYKEVIRDEEED
jgi:hypothetical protein